MLLWYPFGALASGEPAGGLTPSWVSWGPLDPTATAAPQPTFVDRGNGRYGFQFDPELFGDHDGWIDLGEVATTDGRYVYYEATRESSRILSDLPTPQGAVIVLG